MKCKIASVATLVVLVAAVSDLRIASAANKTPKPLQVTDADNGKTVAVAVGRSFDVVLKGNASTGYQWKVDKIDGDGAEQVGKIDYVMDKNPQRMVGVGGRYVVHFKAVKAAKTKIRLAYVRPWEKDKPPEKTFSVAIGATDR
jgi:inhibitor of cysteine peptidase